MDDQVQDEMKKILSDLEKMTIDIRTNPERCKQIMQKLKENGYAHRFGNDEEQSNEEQSNEEQSNEEQSNEEQSNEEQSNEEQSNEEQSNEDQSKQVMRVFAEAVNDRITEKVDITDDEKLCELLGIKPLKNYLTVSKVPGNDITSAHAIAKLFKKKVPQWFVKNLIEQQYKIKWATITGEPENYTYYEFCDSENTTKLLKYTPRQAHVKATLYRECRVKNINKLTAITKEELCPTVYIQTTSGWKTWQATDGENFENANFDKDLEWMKTPTKDFIDKNADKQNDDVESLKKSLKKPTLYWAVLKDNDFKSGEKLKLKDIGETQVYVGKAKNGITGRWIKDGDNHCSMMNKCLDNVRAMTTYDSAKLEGIQLVDARLTLAKVRGEKTALFLIKSFGDDDEKAKIAIKAYDEAEKVYKEATEVYEKATEVYEKAREVYEEAKQTYDEATEHNEEEEQAYIVARENYEEAEEVYEEAEEVYEEATVDYEEAEETYTKEKNSCKAIEANEAEEAYEEAQHLLGLLEQTKNELRQRKADVNEIKQKIILQKKLVQDNKTAWDKAEAEAAKKNKSEVVTRALEDAEKLHRKGKKTKGKKTKGLNIIPPDVCKPIWTPKDMKYGMNKY